MVYLTISSLALSMANFLILLGSSVYGLWMSGYHGEDHCSQPALTSWLKIVPLLNLFSATIYLPFFFSNSYFSQRAKRFHNIIHSIFFIHLIIVLSLGLKFLLTSMGPSFKHPNCSKGIFFPSFILLIIFSIILTFCLILNLIHWICPPRSLADISDYGSDSNSQQQQQQLTGLKDNNYSDNSTDYMNHQPELDYH
jgi:hypothetical protein